MKKEFQPIKRFGGTIRVPGDKSIAHRAALFSILAKNPISITNFPDNEDCHRSLKAAEQLGVDIKDESKTLVLYPPEKLEDNQEVYCGNSGTTARLLSGIIAGSQVTATLTGDESLSKRPMNRVIKPLTEMGAKFESDEGMLPLKITGEKLLPFEYRMEIASAQVKSALLLAALSSNCSISIIEDIISRDHTEQMLSSIGEGITITDIKPVLMQDEHDPRKKKMVMPEDYKRKIELTSSAKIFGGEIDIPGDISTAAFFMAAAAISKQTVTVENLGLNPTRTAFIDHLKNIGCKVEIKNKQTISGEIRGDVTVTGGELKSKKISGETTVGLIDEIPIVSVMAAFADGTTVIRDAQELKVKESDRLMAVAENLKSAGIKCGLLEDGLAIEGAKEFNGADFKSFGDHRIAMAFSIAALFAVGPSTIDDVSVVDISCREFYSILDKVTE